MTVEQATGMMIGFKNYILRPRSEKVYKVGLAIKAFFGSAFVVTFLLKSPDYAFWVLLIGGVLDFVLDLWPQEKVPIPKEFPEPEINLPKTVTKV
jgi:hypothetical protein